MKIISSKAPAAALQKLLDKAGSVAADNKEEPEWVNFNLRIRKDMLNYIEEAIKETPGITKTLWMGLAIQEKIKREKKRNGSSDY